MKKILITGSNGFVGTHITNKLSKEYEVFGIDRFQTNEDKYHIKCDITEQTKVREIIQSIQPNIVIHLAAIVHKNNADTSEENYNHINYECSKFLFDLCKEVNSYVLFASTIEVYGENDQMLIDESSPVNAESFYAKSKLRAEEYLQSLEIRYSILRFTPLYGKNFTLNVDKRVYLKKDKVAYYFKDGSYTFDFCSIENVCKTILYLCDNTIVNEVFIVSDYKSISAKEIIAVNRIRKKIMVLRLPYGFALLAISVLDVFTKSKKDFYFSKRNFKKLFMSKKYSSDKINNLITLDNNYKGSSNP